MSVSCAGKRRFSGLSRRGPSVLAIPISVFKFFQSFSSIWSEKEIGVSVDFPSNAVLFSETGGISSSITVDSAHRNQSGISSLFCAELCIDASSEPATVSGITSS